MDYKMKNLLEIIKLKMMRKKVVSKMRRKRKPK